MNPEQTDRVQAEFHDLVGAYALGAATPAEVQTVTDYLEICRSFEAEIAMLQTTVQALPLLSEELEPPPGLRTSILAAIAAEQAPSPPKLELVPPPQEEVPSQPTSITAKTSGSNWFPWAAVAALLLLSIGLAAWNFTLRDSNTTTVPSIALAATSPEVQGSGEVSYLSDEGVIVVDLQNLAPLPDGQVYQAWVIRGDIPVSAGVVPSGANTLAFAGNPDDYDLLAITVEAGPVGVPAPTTTPLFAVELGTL